MKNKNKLTFSLDCELIWGIQPNLSQYVYSYVSKSQKNLKQLVNSWSQDHPTLYLAFCAAALQEYYDYYPKLISKASFVLSERNYKEFVSRHDLQVFQDSYANAQDNIVLGLHGEFHYLHTQQRCSQLQDEFERLELFTMEYPQYRNFYVPPKNLMPTTPQQTQKLLDTFDLIRFPSLGWLYNNKTYNIFIRFLRYVDSFLPVHELFLLFRLKYYNPDTIYSHFYYRAQLGFPFLEIHVIRVIVGVCLLKLLGKPPHIWSHPHNFSSNRSILYFAKILPLFK